MQNSKFKIDVCGRRFAFALINFAFCILNFEFNACLA